MEVSVTEQTAEGKCRARSLGLFSVAWGFSVSWGRGSTGRGVFVTWRDVAIISLTSGPLLGLCKYFPLSHYRISDSNLGPSPSQDMTT